MIGVEGGVRDANVVESSPLLDDAAKAAARQRWFEPAKTNGLPVAVWVIVPIKFSLNY